MSVNILVGIIWHFQKKKKKIGIFTKNAFKTFGKRKNENEKRMIHI